MTRPLAGASVLVTRPEHQAGALCLALRQAGAHVLAWPTVAISHPADVPALTRALAGLGAVYAMIFVSANAVTAALPAIQALGGLPGAALRLAIGPASAAAVHAAGLGPVQMPATQFDSEGLLALPVLAPGAVQGRQIIIVRGAGGRALLADTLRARGATVRLAEGYARVLPPGDPALLALWLHRDAAHAITLTSRACLDGLLALAGPTLRETLRATPAAVLAPGIATRLREAGWRGAIHVAPEASDAGLLAALHTWRAHASAAAQQQQ